jgi:hypothetical protein
MTGRRFPTLVAICAALSVGCASSYYPREPGRINVVLASGRRVLEKDGKFYGMSGLWSDPIEAVSGNPRAEEHARTFVSRRQTTGVVMLVGLATMAAGLALNTTEPGHMGQKIAARGTAIVSMTAVMASLYVFVFARSHLYDAINIYNDDVFRKSQSGLPTLERDSVQPAANSR